MTIIISQDGKNARKVECSRFEQEDHLQQYIYDNPESIPLYEAKEDIQLLILQREFGTQSGPIDAIGVDAQGEIYLVETKLYKNPDKRLVVAQVLDYGASLWKNGNEFRDFKDSLEKNSRNYFQTSVDEKIKDYFGFEETEIETFWDNVKNNLNDGNFKFVVLMDKLHQRLKDLIVFLNQNSQFDVYAVEVEYYKHDQFEIMIPKLFGAEVKKEIGTNTKRTWNIEEFIARIGSDIDKRILLELRENILKISDNIYEKINKTGISFRTNMEFCSLLPCKENVRLYIPKKLLSDEMKDKYNFDREGTNWLIADIEESGKIEKIVPLIKSAYEASLLK